MKTLLSTIIIVLILFSANLLAQDEDSATTEPDTIAWYRDYDEALKVASSEGRYLLIDFYTDW